MSANAKDSPTLETKQKEIFKTTQESAWMIASGVTCTGLEKRQWLTSLIIRKQFNIQDLKAENSLTLQSDLK